MGIKTKVKSLFLCASILPLAGLASAEPVEIKMTSVFPPGINLVDTDMHFVKTVNEIAGDRIKIKFFPGGTLIPSSQVFDAVSSGAVDAAGDWAGYWAGADSAFSILGSFPMLLTASDYILWLEQWGGYEAFQKVYSKFNIVYLPFGVVSMESGLRSTKALASLEDLKGKKIRMSGRPQGEILQKLGAAQVQLPGGEVYQALERGVVDAAEFSSPGVDWGLGLQEVTSHWLTPGWHQPGSVLGLAFNKNAWNELAPDIQSLLETAAKANLLWSLAYYEKSAVEAHRKFLESGTQISTLSGDEMRRLQELANQALVESACDNSLYAEIAASQVNYLKDYEGWRSLQGDFAMGRNLPILPDVDKITNCIK